MFDLVECLVIARAPVARPIYNRRSAEYLSEEWKNGSAPGAATRLPASATTTRFRSESVEMDILDFLFGDSLSNHLHLRNVLH